MVLAENCGYSPIHTVTEIKSRQIVENNPYLGIDCMQMGTSGNYLRVKITLRSIFNYLFDVLFYIFPNRYEETAGNRDI